MRKFIVVATAAMILAGCQTVRHDPTLTGVAVDGGNAIPRRHGSFERRHKPGTIVISTKERRLYLVTGAGEALRYGVGVGRLGFAWRGVHRVSAKREWPDWTLRRQPDLPRHMPGGADNPLGARALYLGSTLYRIHGSNEPETIGSAVSSGCFRASPMKTSSTCMIA